LSLPVFDAVRLHTPPSSRPNSSKHQKPSPLFPALALSGRGDERKTCSLARRSEGPAHPPGGQNCRGARGAARAGLRLFGSRHGHVLRGCRNQASEENGQSQDFPDASHLHVDTYGDGQLTPSSTLYSHARNVPQHGRGDRSRLPSTLDDSVGGKVQGRRLFHTWICVFSLAL